MAEQTTKLSKAKQNKQTPIQLEPISLLVAFIFRKQTRMSNSQQAFRSGDAYGHAQEKTDQMMESAKNTAQSAQQKAADAAHSTQQKAADAAHSTQQSAEHGAQSTTAFLQQTGEQMMNMAKGAMDSVKNTLGGGDSQVKK